MAKPPAPPRPTVDLPAHDARVRLTRKRRKVVFRKLRALDPKPLAEAAAEEHAAVFARVRCGDCARCCQTISPIFTDRDIPKVARAVGLRPAEFTERYLRLDEDHDYVLKGSPCPFLGDDKSCMIYDDRPKACREYPHTDSPRQRQLLDLTERNVEVCPAAYEVVERVARRLLGLGFEEGEGGAGRG
ncbi:MAG: YkgJ family cysteine cluster protein [Deltaproteobacteria bacterium]|nr:YkgJ family cysteine cluster protein [Deltaproteobacteria bacterium]